MQQQWTVSWLDCDVWLKVNLIWQPVMTSSVVGLRRSSKALPKAKLSTKKVMITIWWSADSLIHYNFLNPGETIPSEMYAQQTNETHWRLQCLQLALISRKGPIVPHDNARLHITQPMLQKWNELDYGVLFYLSYSPDLSPTKYHFFKHLDNFLYGKCFHDQ